MRPLTRLVGQVGVRRELPATLLPRPLFTGTDKCRTDSLPSGVWNDVPPFEVADTIGAAGVHDVVDREFDEADGAMLLVEGHEHFGRPTAIAGQKPVDVALVLVEGGVRPECMPKAYPVSAIVRQDGSDRGHEVQRYTEINGLRAHRTHAECLSVVT